MPGDFVSQLQLAKQLEQKAKEAARSRRAAEEKIAEAELAITSMKEFDITSAESQRLFIEAKDALARRDFEASLSLAVQCINSVQNAKCEKIDQMLKSATELVNLFESGDADHGAILESVRNVQNLVSEKKLTEAYENAKKIADRAEQYVNRKMAELFGKVQSLLVLADSVGLKVEEERQLLSHARRWFDEAQYSQTIKELHACLSRIRDLFRTYIESKFNKLLELRASLLSLRFDPSKIDEILLEIKRRVEENDFEIALRNLKIAEIEAQNLLVSGLRNGLIRLQKIKELLEINSINIGDAEKILSDFQEFLKSQQLEKAKIAYEEAARALSKAVGEFILQSVLKMQHRLVIAKKLNIDLDEVARYLESSKKSYKSGEFENAVEFIHKADASLKKALEEYESIEAEFARIKQLLIIGNKYSVDLGRAKERIKNLKGLIFSHNFKAAAEELKEAQREAHIALQQYFAKNIMDLELMVADVAKMGADIAEVQALLDDIINAAKEGRYEEVADSIRQCREIINEKMMLAAREIIASALKFIETRSEHIDISVANSILNDAKAALEKGEYERAYSLGKSALENVRKSETNAIARMLEEAEKQLEIAKNLGADSVTLREKLKKAAALRESENFSEAFESVVEVINLSASIIADELTRRLTPLLRDISSMRRTGIAVGKIERMIEEASLAIGKKEFMKAYEVLNQIENLIKGTKTLHAEIYDKIVEISNLLKEAKEQGRDISDAMSLLLKAKRNFESGRYEEAKELIDQCYASTEKIVAPFIATRRIPIVRDLLSIMKRIGLERGQVERLLAEADEAVRSERFLEALNSSREAEQIATTSLIREISMRIENIRSSISEATKKGQEVAIVEGVIQKAESLLKDGRFNEALKAIDLAKAEIDQAIVVERKAAEHVQLAERIIGDVEAMIDVTASKNLIDQAKKMMNQGKFVVASELAKNAAEQATRKAIEWVMDELAKIEEFFRKEGLEGIESKTLSSSIEEIRRLANVWQFKQVRSMISTLRNTMERLRQQRDLTAKTLEEIKIEVSKAREQGLKVDHISEKLRNAEEKMKAGSFSEAFAIGMSCSEELKSIHETLNRRIIECEEIKKKIQVLRNNGIDVSGLRKMTESVEEALKSLDFERAALLIQRVNTKASAELKRLVGMKREELSVLLDLTRKAALDEEASKLVESIASAEKVDSGSIDIDLIESHIQVIKSTLLEAITGKLIENEKKSGKETSLSERLLSEAQESLETGDFGRSIELIEEARANIGTSVEEFREIENLKSKIRGMIESAQNCGLPINRMTYEELLQRIDNREFDRPKSILNALNEAASLLKDELERLAPAIVIESVDPGMPIEGKWCSMKIALRNKGVAMARDISIEISGDLDYGRSTTRSWLKGGEALVIEIKYLPKRSGILEVDIIVKWKPAFSEEILKSNKKVNLEVGRGIS
ncbi:MAG: hypothetical protein QXN93_01950 [Methanomassiliicoccales archaeon]